MHFFIKLVFLLYIFFVLPRCFLPSRFYFFYLLFFSIRLIEFRKSVHSSSAAASIFELFTFACFHSSFFCLFSIHSLLLSEKKLLVPEMENSVSYCAFTCKSTELSQSFHKKTLKLHIEAQIFYNHAFHIWISPAWRMLHSHVFPTKICIFFGRLKVIFLIYTFET